MFSCALKMPCSAFQFYVVMANLLFMRHYAYGDDQKAGVEPKNN